MKAALPSAIQPIAASEVKGAYKHVWITDSEFELYDFVTVRTQFGI
jgi:hypothetical protein